MRSVSCLRFPAVSPHSALDHSFEKHPPKEPTIRGPEPEMQVSSQAKQRRSETQPLKRLVTMGYFIPLVLMSAAGCLATLNKCCPRDQKLSMDMKKCMDLAGPPVQDLWWIPNGTVFLNQSTMKEIGPDEPSAGWQYGRRPDCERPEVIPGHEDWALSRESLLFWSDGIRPVVIPSGWFCADGAGRGHVLLACPPPWMTTVAKCCYRGLALSLARGPARCVLSRLHDWSPFPQEYTGSAYFLRHGLPKCKDGVGHYLETDYKILADGRAKAGTALEPVIPSEYCGESLVDSGSASSALLVCRRKTPARSRLLYGCLQAIGSVPLAGALFVLLLLPELRRSPYAKGLLSHIALLFAGYIVLAAKSFDVLPASKQLCIATAFSIQFSFLASFFWLNVMGIDIAWTFSTFSAPKANSLVESERKKFLYYSLYVWGCTGLITAVTMLAEFLPHIPKSKYRPNFGGNKCWFKDGQAAMVYFYLPVAILLLVNTILFVYTSVKILKIRRETNILLRSDSGRHEGGRSQTNEERRFLLYLKLFTIMGISWVFEIISWASSGHQDVESWWWYATDALNAFRGFFIFAVVCCKKKVFNLFRAKVNRAFNLGPRTPPARKAPSTECSTLQTTNSYQLSVKYTSDVNS
ncbi:hypothetical protein AAG570_012947 [Ranatra chinensis]|uniref:G-protein coupled receptors family 2 profile 2 domain-containing protein n=1 Tax=Ranatra chinensis TaxID=642074 RepID=A0ABD0Z3M2_9HEMI